MGRFWFVCLGPLSYSGPQHFNNLLWEASIAHGAGVDLSKWKTCSGGKRWCHCGTVGKWKVVAVGGLESYAKPWRWLKFEYSLQLKWIETDTLLRPTSGNSWCCYHLHFSQINQLKPCFDRLIISFFATNEGMQYPVASQKSTILCWVCKSSLDMTI